MAVESRWYVNLLNSFGIQPPTKLQIDWCKNYENWHTVLLENMNLQLFLYEDY